MNNLEKQNWLNYESPFSMKEQGVIENTRTQDKASWRSGNMHVMEYRNGYSGYVFFAYIGNQIVRSNGLAAKFTDIATAKFACEQVSMAVAA